MKRQAADLHAAPTDVDSCVSVVFPRVHHRIPAAVSIPLPAETGILSTQTATDTACPFFSSSFVFFLISLLII